jgi:hypothetical protein
LDSANNPVPTAGKIDMPKGESALSKARRGAETTYTYIKSSVAGAFSWTSAVPIKVAPIDVEAVFGGMVGTLYKWALGLGGVTALVLITYGGFLYSISMGNVSQMTEGRKWIIAALEGLALLFGAFLLLSSISTCFVGAC